MARSTSKEIDRFLCDVRSAISTNKCIHENRQKTLRTMASLTMTPEDVEDELYLLNVSDYVSGPEPDRDRPGTDGLWIFQQYFKGEKIYVKLKILYQNGERLLILSFHISEFA